MKRVSFKIKTNILVKASDCLCYIIYLMLFIVLISSALPLTSWANSNIFVSTSEQMVERLSARPIRARSFSPCRGISVVTKKNGEIKNEIIQVGGNYHQSNINMKIKFDYNSAIIRPDSTHLLDELADALISSKLKDKRFLLCGHTDSDGSSEYNLNLSLQRALSVRDYLVLFHHIKSSRLDVYGYGESLPLYPNDDKELKKYNRRVEVKMKNTSK